MSLLELKVPPPVVGLLCAGLMAYLAQITPAVAIGDARVFVAVFVCAVGFGVMVAGVVSFRRARTTINPLKPQTASVLVTRGVFGYTRNPMYLGELVVLLGWGVFLASPAALIGVVAFWYYIQRFQIEPEERALSTLFGRTYADYSARVRRWL